MKKFEKWINNNYFVLGGKKLYINNLQNLEKLGGATLRDGILYSNTQGDIKLHESQKVGIYIPSTYDVDKEAKQSLIGEYIDKAKSLLNSELVIKVNGFWRDTTSGENVKEDIYIVEAHNKDVNTLKQALELANEIKEAFKQQGVSVEVDEQLIIV